MSNTNDTNGKLPPPRVMRVKRVARDLDCSEGLVRKLAREGKLDQIYIGGDVRITVESLEALLRGER